MGYTRNLGQIRTSLTIRGGFENSSDLTSTVLNEIINDALLETYDILVEQWQDYYTILGSNTSLVSGKDSYSLPSDFYKLRKVEIAIDSTLTKWRKLRPADLSDSTRHQDPSVCKRYRYRMQSPIGPGAGSSEGPLVLMPVPASSTETIRVWYIPLGPQLTVDTDTVVFDVPAEIKLVLNIAYRDCLIRQDLDSSAIEREIEKLSANLRRAGDSRDAAEPFYLGDYADYDESEYT